MLVIVQEQGTSLSENYLVTGFKENLQIQLCRRHQTLVYGQKKVVRAETQINRFRNCVVNWKWTTKIEGIKYIIKSLSVLPVMPIVICVWLQCVTLKSASSLLLFNVKMDSGLSLQTQVNVHQCMSVVSTNNLNVHIQHYVFYLLQFSGASFNVTLALLVHLGCLMMFLSCSKKQ